MKKFHQTLLRKSLQNAPINSLKFNNYLTLCIYNKVMSLIIYQRPREKLQYYGVKSLSYVELIQLIIGSGNHGISGAHIAASINKLLLTNSNPTFAELMNIDGLGVAKSCLLLASLEISKRNPRGSP